MGERVRKRKGEQGKYPLVDEDEKLPYWRDELSTRGQSPSSLFWELSDGLQGKGVLCQPKVGGAISGGTVVLLEATESEAD